MFPSVASMLPMSLSTVILPPCSLPSERIPLIFMLPGDVRLTSPAIPSSEYVFNTPFASILFSLSLLMVIFPPF